LPPLLRQEGKEEGKGGKKRANRKRSGPRRKGRPSSLFCFSRQTRIKQRLQKGTIVSCSFVKEGGKGGDITVMSARKRNARLCKIKDPHAGGEENRAFFRAPWEAEKKKKNSFSSLSFPGKKKNAAPQKKKPQANDQCSQSQGRGGSSSECNPRA